MLGPCRKQKFLLESTYSGRPERIHWTIAGRVLQCTRLGIRTRLVNHFVVQRIGIEQKGCHTGLAVQVFHDAIDFPVPRGDVGPLALHRSLAVLSRDRIAVNGRNVEQDEITGPGLVQRFL